MMLQGKSLFAQEMLSHVSSFKTKLSLFARQADEDEFCHFPFFTKTESACKCFFQDEGSFAEFGE